MKNLFRIIPTIVRGACLWPVLALLCLGVSGQARAEFKLTEDLTVTPNLYVSEEYSDNLFLAPDNEEDDFLTTLYPHIRLEYSSKYLFIDETYGHEFIYYKDHPENEQSTFTETQRSSAYVQLIRRNDFNINLWHRVERASYGDRYTFNEENDLTRKTRVTTYRINPTYLYDQIQTFRVRADYLYENINYDAADADDWAQHQVTLKLEKDINARDDLLRSEIQAARIEPETYETYERAHVKVGGLIHLAPYWILEGDIGRARIYPKNGDNIDITIGDIFLSYDKDAIHAKVGYAMTYPLIGDYNDGAYKIEYVEAGLVIKKRAILGLHASAIRSHYFDQPDTDDTFRSTVKLDIPLSKRTWVSASGDWSVYDYGTGEDSDTRYGAGLGIFRNFRWGEGGIQYYYNARASDNDARDYEQNYVRVFINITF